MIIPAQTLRVLQPIKPFHERTIAHGMTYGLGPAGYDVRIAENIQLKPGAFALASTIEEFFMPEDALATVHDKSTWARQGIAVQTTVIEPGWTGFLTLEVTNHSYNTIEIREGSPIAQIIFHRLEQATVIPYRGRYQNQGAGPQPALLVKENS